MPSQTWTDELIRALVRAMVQIIMDNRTVLYHHPDLTPVAVNRGSLINSKAQTILKKLVAQYGFDNEDVVGNCITGNKRSPKKGGAVKEEKEGKKRKRVKRQESDQDDQDDLEDVKPS